MRLLVKTLACFFCWQFFLNESVFVVFDYFQFLINSVHHGKQKFGFLFFNIDALNFTAL